MFNTIFPPALVGKSPTLVFIAGVIFLVNRSKEALLIKTSILGVVQNTRTGFTYNSKPNLNLEYTMNHVNFLGYVQKVTLYQVGDLNRGISISSPLLLPRIHAIFFEGDPSTPCWMP